MLRRKLLSLEWLQKSLITSVYIPLSQPELCVFNIQKMRELRPSMEICVFECVYLQVKMYIQDGEWGFIGEYVNKLI